MFTLTWLKDAAERALSTAAQTVLASIGVTAVDVVHLNWGAIASLAGGAALISILKSLVVGATPVGTPGTATPVTLRPRPKQTKRVG